MSRTIRPRRHWTLWHVAIIFIFMCFVLSMAGHRHQAPTPEPHITPSMTIPAQGSKP